MTKFMFGIVLGTIATRTAEAIRVNKIRDRISKNREMIEECKRRNEDLFHQIPWSIDDDDKLEDIAKAISENKKIAEKCKRENDKLEGELR